MHWCPRQRFLSNFSSNISASSACSCHCRTYCLGIYTTVIELNNTPVKLPKNTRLLPGPSGSDLSVNGTQKTLIRWPGNLTQILTRIMWWCNRTWHRTRVGPQCKWVSTKKKIVLLTRQSNPGIYQDWTWAGPGSCGSVTRCDPGSSYLHWGPTWVNLQ